MLTSIVNCPKLCPGILNINLKFYSKIEHLRLMIYLDRFFVFGAKVLSNQREIRGHILVND